MSIVIVDKKESFLTTCESFNVRFNMGKKWIDIYKDVEDGEDSLAMRIALTFSEMGEMLRFNT